jgi:LPXTG-motif cell wall-anchored protein
MKKIILLSIFLFLVLPPFNTFAETNNKEIDLTTDPGKELFNINNAIPGDSFSRNLVIKNNGKQDFHYIITSKFLSGSEIFYDKLDLTVSDSNGILYKGKLFEFQKLAPRLLKSKQNENLLFHIQIPLELGNEFQGMETQFLFKFYVEGTLGGLLPAGGPKLPETGSNMFNLLTLGAVLILLGLALQLFAKRKRKQL